MDMPSALHVILSMKASIDEADGVLFQLVMIELVNVNVFAGDDVNL